MVEAWSPPVAPTAPPAARLPATCGSLGVSRSGRGSTAVKRSSLLRARPSSLFGKLATDLSKRMTRCATVPSLLRTGIPESVCVTSGDRNSARATGQMLPYRCPTPLTPAGLVDQITTTIQAVLTDHRAELRTAHTAQRPPESQERTVLTTSAVLADICRYSVDLRPTASRPDWDVPHDPGSASAPVQDNRHRSGPTGPGARSSP